MKKNRTKVRHIYKLPKVKTANDIFRGGGEDMRHSLASLKVLLEKEQRTESFYTLLDLIKKEGSQDIKRWIEAYDNEYVEIKDNEGNIEQIKRKR